MAGSDVRHGRRFALVLVVALVVACAVLWRSGRLDPYVERLRDREAAAGPAAVAPPGGLALPAVAAPAPVALPAAPAGTALMPESVRRVLAPSLRDDDLGRHV
ncbi:MAG: hypothetical protein LH468_02190, partial [Nocardioides sp.]|nr:hypothetical protein [Nocardioides sp.]